jgi:hypothetical protein
MPYTPPTVNYNSGSDSTWYTITGVQSVNISRGRQRFQDPVSQSSMVVELIPANSYTLPFAIGQAIDVRDTNDTSAVCYFQGRITDVQRSYAFPYSAGTGAAPADRIRITAAGATGIIGTGQSVSQSLTNTYTYSSIATMAGTQGVAWSGSGADNTVKNSAQTFTGAALDGVNQLLRTSQTTIDDCVVPRSSAQIYAITTWANGVEMNPLTFTDTGTGYSYSGLEFLSSVQNTFNWIELEATGVYTVIAALGSAPFNALLYSTFSETPTDASNLAIYLWYMLSGQVQAAPFSIATSTVNSASCMQLAQLVKDGASYPYDRYPNAVMGQPVSVTFRGSSTNGTVIGVNAAFYPDRGNVQLYLSPSLGTPFTLDSSAFGVLDQNRLGFP